ncbi:hypothetical protein [Tamaricihabitans halophyticus]|uniref:hypothetical protein n=1 Tax=Tamaricihabitans halophyticus TaxID=1262583 RepID=UPI001FB50D49|nr:hypothetical protein [Tamaricihabitans halophyticus]
MVPLSILLATAWLVAAEPVPVTAELPGTSAGLVSPRGGTVAVLSVVASIPALGTTIAFTLVESLTWTATPVAAVASAEVSLLVRSASAGAALTGPTLGGATLTGPTLPRFTLPRSILAGSTLS